MKPIARFSAPRAALPSVARICSHLALPLCLISFSTSSLGLSVRHDCGDAEAAPGRFIVRAVSTKQALSAQGEAVQASSTRDMSVIDSLILEKPSRLIHKSRASATLTVAGEKVAAENSVDNSVVTVASRLSTEQLSALQTDPSVLSIEQDCIVHVDSLPNDPVPAQYTFVRDSLNLEKAWSRKTDSSNIVVAISDTGVDVNHADLHDNIWTNVSELSGRPGIDDDGNGCIDDVHGCDFGDYDGDPSPFTSGEGDHGTHVAGIIGAIGNNSAGAVGVSWQATLMAVKGFDSAGNALVSDLLNTLYYSVNNGARVINCSWGANRVPTQAEKDAFQFAISNGVLPVVAAGNSGIDAAKTSPAGIDGVLTVGSVNSLDQVSGFSNYGSHVAVYAPGGDAMAAGGTRDEFIYSTLPTAHGAYGTMRGTSMAAPFVTGIAALVFSVNPKLSAVDVKQIIVSTSRRVNSKLPDGTHADIQIPDADAAIVLASTFPPTAYSVSSPASSNTGYKSTSPSTSGANAPAAAPSSSSSGGCSLRRDRTNNDGWTHFVFLLIPFCWLITLRTRNERKT